MDMFEEKVLGERYPDLNEDEDIRIEDIMKKNWRDVANYGENKINIHALRWYIYTIQKEEFIKKEFLVSVTHTKGGGIVWTCVKDNIIEEKEQYDAIGLRGFDYKLFE